MANKNNDTYVLVREDIGENILCPIVGKKNAAATNVYNTEDCFEENVAGRYAGNIKIRPS